MPQEWSYVTVLTLGKSWKNIFILGWFLFPWRKGDAYLRKGLLGDSSPANCPSDLEGPAQAKERETKTSYILLMCMTREAESSKKVWVVMPWSQQEDTNEVSIQEMSLTQPATRSQWKAKNDLRPTSLVSSGIQHSCWGTWVQNEAIINHQHQTMLRRRGEKMSCGEL